MIRNAQNPSSSSSLPLPSLPVSIQFGGRKGRRIPSSSPFLPEWVCYNCASTSTSCTVCTVLCRRTSIPPLSPSPFLGKGGHCKEEEDGVICMPSCHNSQKKSRRRREEGCAGWVNNMAGGAQARYEESKKGTHHMPKITFLISLSLALKPGVPVHKHFPYFPCISCHDVNK